MSEPTPPDSSADDRQSLNTRALTWAALLGRWVDFARGSVALPDDAAGRALRASVPDVIMLQAVYFALQELGELPRDEQALGVDRAAVLVERHRHAIEQRWPRDQWPGNLEELVRDAEQALASSAGKLGSAG